MVRVKFLLEEIEHSKWNLSDLDFSASFLLFVPDLCIVCAFVPAILVFVPLLAA